MSKTYEKDLVRQLGFSPKEKESGIFRKKYTNGYVIEINFDKKIINYGKDIKFDSKTTQNFSQAENFVVLECVNRLLEKGYNPKDIILEKVFPAGHGTSGRLDILVKKENKPYLMIECKTYGEEFDKELRKTQKNGGQIFTYFQQDTKTELLMLYASKLEKNKIISNFRIINIEEDFRNAGSVEKVFNLWNGKFYEKGFWENPPYGFQLEKITKADLRELTEDEGKKLFHGFATILRKHSVSDKPNAFNVIFNLFLAKLYDEQGGDEDELKFQWKSNDDPVDFQVRLYNLHKAGLFDFLKKEIEGIEDFKTTDETEMRKQQKKFLKFNKLFDIKSVFNDDDFEQNHRVLKEVVKLIEKYKIRYPRKQKYLSEFFELLLTTGLKQESGQYFTPSPIAKFIVKSLPLPAMIKQEIDQTTPKLPAVIDYAAGSGHFITEIMEEYQDIIDNLDISSLHYPNAKTKAKTWSKDGDPYLWASSYVYGIEKDYRLVKVAKVGCYFYGDGLAQVIHGDGLDSFEKSKSYIGLLKENTPKKPQFSIVVSNPPYSVSDCKDDLEYIGSQNDFELYRSLTDKSKEIECLFVERTKHLLKEGGVAGVILPSSMLSNEGIYTKTREIILQYFDIVAITQLGGNTFMETKTNTVVLFLRRKNDSQIKQLKETIEAVFDSLKDCTVNGIENAVSLYLKHVWNGVSLSDYKSFIQKKPNEKIKKHSLYKEYRPKEYTLEDFTNGDTSAIAIEYAEKQLKKLNDAFWIRINSLEKEKFFYFVLTYKQKVVLIKTGEKDDEKRFLGYEFSGRRGNEGIHPIQRDKPIDECTRLFDDKIFDNPEKASTYIYKTFNDDNDFPIHESLKNNIFRVDLVDMLNFDRANFEKNISTAVKKKVKIESTWERVKLGDILSLEYGKSLPESKRITGIYPVIGSSGICGYHNEYFVEAPSIIIGRKGSVGKITYITENCYPIDTTFYVLTKSEINFQYLYNALIQLDIENGNSGIGVPGINRNVIYDMFIPLPPKEIQQKIVAEIEVLETEETEVKEKIENWKNKIEQLFTEVNNKANTTFRLSDDIFDISIGKRVIEADLNKNGSIPVYSANVFEPFGYIDKYLINDFSIPSVLWGIDGDWMVNYIPADKPFYPTDHCGVLRIKTNDILPKYLAWILNKEGIAQNFSRTLRASIDRIKGISIKIPLLSEQQKIVAEIENIEVQMNDMQKELEQLSTQKGLVLKKYM
jgi:type I restriction enzyme M protein